jgi:hypothetical protein
MGLETKPQVDRLRRCTYLARVEPRVRAGRSKKKSGLNCRKIFMLEWALPSLCYRVGMRIAEVSLDKDTKLLSA